MSKTKEIYSRRSTRIKVQEASIGSPRQRTPVIKSKGPVAPKRKSPIKKKSQSTKVKSPKQKSAIVYEGKPKTALPNDMAWPAGWTECQHQRTSGKSSGTVDKYFSPPNQKSKLRSILEVMRYMDAWNKRKDAAQSLAAAKGVAAAKKAPQAGTKKRGRSKTAGKGKETSISRKKKTKAADATEAEEEDNNVESAKETKELEAEREETKEENPQEEAGDKPTDEAAVDEKAEKSDTTETDTPNEGAEVLELTATTEIYAYEEK